MDELRTAIRAYSTDVIVNCIETIGGAFDVSRDVRMTRAALIDVYVERTSPEDGDALMDRIGLGL